MASAYATVEVTLVRGPNMLRSEVYGRLRANNGTHTIELFQKGSSEPVLVPVGQLIPLSKSSLAVPLGSSLEIMADLSDRQPNGTFEIAKGTIVFPQQTAPCDKNIATLHGEIRVKVIWN